MKEKISSLCNHLLIILSLAFLAFLVLHYYNGRMGFLTSRFVMALLGIYCLLSIGNSLFSIAVNAKKKRHKKEESEKGGGK